MSEIKKTITSIFMVPTLGIDRERLKDNKFINAYTIDGKREVQYENAVYLVFKPENVDKFKEFLDSEYERTKRVIDDYDYEEGFVIVVYQLDTNYNRDFNLIKKGKYSKTSIEFQKLFPKVIKILKDGLRRDEISLQYRIFNKTEDLIKYWEDKLGTVFDSEQEIWNAFIVEDETLNINKIKEHV